MLGAGATFTVTSSSRVRVVRLFSSTGGHTWIDNGSEGNKNISRSLWVHIHFSFFFLIRSPDLWLTPPGTTPRKVLALPLVLRTWWKNVPHLNYFVANDCTLTSVSLIILLTPLWMHVCLSLFQPKGMVTLDLCTCWWYSAELCSYTSRKFEIRWINWVMFNSILSKVC